MTDRTLYFECFAGLSGDMCLAALINLGVPVEHMREELSKLGIDSEYDLVVSESQKLGIHGLRVDVKLHDNGHDHGHAHSHHHHDHDHDHHRDHHHHQQRDYKQICEMIDGSDLTASVKKRAHEVFVQVARAEATIHNMPVETVHFHEVGATDSIVDIVGAAIGIEYLVEHEGLTRIISSPLELGSGMVKCAHGTYPVPAPATAEILKDVPVTKGGVKGEAATPTGAAILKACVDEFVDQVKGVGLKTVYGIGHRDADIPNVVRLQLMTAGTSTLGHRPSGARHAKIEANIDDMSPEAFEPLLERLFEAGASDAYVQPITMKKSRPAQMLCVLCREDLVQALGEIVLNHSSTIGLRILPFQKMVLPREIVSVPTSAGEISVKIVVQPDGLRRFKSEHDEIAVLAKKTGESYLALKRRIDAEIEAFLSDQTGEANG